MPRISAKDFLAKLRDGSLGTGLTLHGVIRGGPSDEDAFEFSFGSSGDRPWIRIPLDMLEEEGIELLDYRTRAGADAVAVRLTLKEPTTEEGRVFAKLFERQRDALRDPLPTRLTPGIRSVRHRITIQNDTDKKLLYNWHGPNLSGPYPRGAEVRAGGRDSAQTDYAEPGEEKNIACSFAKYNEDNSFGVHIGRVEQTFHTSVFGSPGVQEFGDLRSSYQGNTVVIYYRGNEINRIDISDWNL